MNILKISSTRSLDVKELGAKKLAKQVTKYYCVSHTKFVADQLGYPRYWKEESEVPAAPEWKGEPDKASQNNRNDRIWETASEMENLTGRLRIRNKKGFFSAKLQIRL